MYCGVSFPIAVIFRNLRTIVPVLFNSLMFLRRVTLGEGLNNRWDIRAQIHLQPISEMYLRFLLFVKRSNFCSIQQDMTILWRILYCTSEQTSFGRARIFFSFEKARVELRSLIRVFTNLSGIISARNLARMSIPMRR